ncbi:hypothetical protein BBJ29_008319 [Phytophthora kernoviae]|uniref:BZIP domain-containing protein n=1 Tax=Phytophthora kernoviae TaxID=325452 RepID=A0A3F2REM5_9STRA|nr:hypothetical protein BBJ29_008319 [Phytophthora kernoviae]RLN54921.1 hypothetical protein BBP00_00008724 [Phytophthora kernoviae]
MSQNASRAANNGKGKTPASGSKDAQEDEKVLRRRLQYMLHQRRHRAKQKQKVTTLELEVRTLMEEVETLNRRRQKLLVDNNFFASRGTASGVPARVAMEYFQLFQFGASPLHIDQQEQFLRAVMTPETEGPDYKGVDVVVTQWRRYCNFFTYARYDPVSIDVSTVGDLTVVIVNSMFHIRGRRDGIVALYPALNGEQELMQKVVGSMISIHGKYRFTFDSNGMITWFSAEWDLVDALQRVLGSLVDVSTVLSGANISSSTGQIRVEESRPKPRVDPRHNGPTVA